jgi:preprotein translocase subunit SecA
MYEELRGLIRHGVASAIFRVTVQKQPSTDAGLAQSLARGAAALTGASGDGNGAGAARQPVAAGAATSARAAGSAIVRGSLPSAPAARNVTESLGDTARPGGDGSAPGVRQGYTPTGARIGRNDPCWCGSGAKYKKCHGR